MEMISLKNNVQSKPEVIKPSIVKPLKLKETDNKKTAKIKNFQGKKIKNVKRQTFNLKARSLGKAKLTYKVTQYPKKSKKCMTVTKSGKVTLKKKPRKEHTRSGSRQQNIEVSESGEVCDG